MTADNSRRDEAAEPAIRRTCDLAHPFEASFGPLVHGPLSTVVRASITPPIVSGARRLLLGDEISLLRPGGSTSRTATPLEELKRAPTFQARQTGGAPGASGKQPANWGV